MKVTLAMIALIHIFIGRLWTFHTAKRAWKAGGEASESLMQRINANPQWRFRYRCGQIAYVIGIILFAVCFFI